RISRAKRPSPAAALRRDRLSEVAHEGGEAGHAGFDLVFGAGEADADVVGSDAAEVVAGDEGDELLGEEGFGEVEGGVDAQARGGGCAGAGLADGAGDVGEGVDGAFGGADGDAGDLLEEIADERCAAVEGLAHVLDAVCGVAEGGGDGGLDEAG